MEVEAKTQERTWFFSQVFGWILTNILKAANGTRKIAQDDPRRIIHSLKVGLSLTLISLVYYYNPLYNGFKEAGIWAVLTVVVVSEFTVGATLSKSMNRGVATFLAGALGVGTQQLAGLLGDKGEPIALGFFVFLLAAASTFTRFFPRIKARYDYGVLIFILTFSLVSVSGYRVDKILELAHQRLSTILLGGATCIIISIFLCPKMHFSGFGGEYFKDSGDGDGDGEVVTKGDKSSLEGYKANFAWWEPGHGNFSYRHPWNLYLKIGVLARKCASHFEVLSIYINSETPAPKELQRIIQVPCMEMSSESGKALKELALAIKTTTHPSSADVHIHKTRAAADELKTALSSSSADRAHLLEIIPALAATSILSDIVQCVEQISESVHELSAQAHFKKAVEATVSPQKTAIASLGNCET
ncbi:hypothetical protein NMG60_11008573, partial [Bertholletia excelsa]